MNRYWSIVIGFFALALGIGLRFYDIDLRPLHHDEGVNHFFVEQMPRDGFYKYSHENYHGPTYFYLLWATWNWLGDTELGMRLSAIIPGIILLAVAVLAGQRSGRADPVERWTAAALLALSPVAVFYSRYAIHESLFVLLTVILAFALWRWLQPDSSKTACEVIGALALGSLAATKETYIVAVFSLGVGVLCSCPKVFFVTAWRRALGVGGGLMLAAVVLVAWVAVRFAPAATYANAHSLGEILLVFLQGVTFEWDSAIAEIGQGIPQWISRNDADTGHHKPWMYYVGVLATFEWGILGLWLAVLLGTPRSLLQVHVQHPWVRFLGGWSFSALVVYSTLSYKMPWLALNIVVPWTLYTGAVVSRVNWNPWLAQWLVLLSLLVTTPRALLANVWMPYGKENPLAYVHTLAGCKEFVADLERYLTQYRGERPAQVAIRVDGYWPLPFYFAQLKNKGLQFSVGFHGAGDPSFEVEDVIFVETWVGSANPPPAGWTRTYYRLADHEDGYVYYRATRSTAAQR